MDPNDISLDNINKLFEYEKIARYLDSIDDIDLLKTITKSYVKLYLKQQEVLSKI